MSPGGKEMTEITVSQANESNLSEIKSAPIWKYVLLFLGSYIGLNICIVAVLYYIDIGNASFGTAILVTAAIIPLYRFAKTQKRLWTKREKWIMTGWFVLISTCIEMILAIPVLLAGEEIKEEYVTSGLLIGTFGVVLIVNTLTVLVAFWVAKKGILKKILPAMEQNNKKK
jgi:hypothetical protein